MSREVVQRVIASLQAGVNPIYRLRPRKGIDSRLMRITGSDNQNFHGVFIDSKEEESVLLPHKTVENRSITMEEMHTLAS